MKNMYFINIQKLNQTIKKIQNILIKTVGSARKIMTTSQIITIKRYIKKFELIKTDN